MVAKLVITVALKAELPIDWLCQHDIPVLSFKKLANSTSKVVREQVGSARIVVIITGIGPILSQACALWIKQILPVLYVVNIGTAGSINGDFLFHWITPVIIATENGISVKVDVYLPFVWPVNLKRYIGGTLLTVVQPVLGELPEQWKPYQFLDMEAAAQAQVFKQVGIAFYIIKYITDDSSQTAKKQFKTALKQLRYELHNILTSILDALQKYTLKNG